MERLPVVPDVVLERALPGRPDTWRGRAGRRAVDVTVVVLPADAAIRRAALATLTPLVASGGAPLPRGRAATLCRDGLAFVADACTGGPLPRRLSTRQVRELGAPAAEMLEALHGRGLTWGGSAAEMLVAGGDLQLPYDGMVRRRIAGRVGSVAADLTALLSALADRCADAELVELVAHPPPTARGLVRALRGLGRPPRARRRLLLPVAGGAVVVAAAVGWWSALPPRQIPTTVSDLDAWTTTVHLLDVARSAALSGNAPLSAADAAGSSADGRDAATRAVLVRRHLLVVAPEPQLAQVIPLELTPQSATLRVTDMLGGYVFRDAAGRVVGRVAARGLRTWTVTLRRTAAGWRFASVS